MNNLLTVLKATFINDWGLNGFSKSVTSTKEKKKVFMTLLTMIIGVVAIGYVVTVYALLMADSLEQIGFLQLIIVMGIVFSVFATFFTSIYKAQGSLFAAKDYDLLMSLPIKSSTLLISKLINLLLLNWVSIAFAVVPTTIIYFIRTENISWAYFIIVLISIFFIPLIPVIIAALTAIVISYFASKFRYKNLTIIVGTSVLFVLIMIGSFKMQSIMEYIFANTSSIIEGIGKVYPPVLYLTNALVEVNFIELFKFMLVSIIPFIIFVIAFSKIFNKINARLNETYKKSNYKMKSLKVKSSLRALINKEVKRYFSTPIYVMNTSIGMIMAIIAAIATLFVDGETLAMFMDIPYARDIFPLMILGVMIFCIGLASTTNSSISLEGKNLWIIKSLPIEIKDIFLGKIVVSLLITLPATIVVNLIFWVGLKFEVIYFIFNLIITVIYCLFSAALGLIINLYLPKLEWTTPTVVVKQSASVLITMLCTFASIGLPVGAFILFKITNITMFLSIIVIILIVAFIISVVILNNAGIEKFKKL